MVVAIQKGIEGLKSKLTEKGYQVVYYDEYPHPIDAYIYIGYANDIGYSSHSFSNTVSNISHSTSPRTPGCLQINARYHSLPDIIRLLSTHFHTSYNYIH